jgi:hypothetical protein
MRYLTQHILLGNAAFVFMIVALLTSWWQRAPLVSRVCQGIAVLSITASLVLGSIATMQTAQSIAPLHLVYAVLVLVACIYLYWLTNYASRASIQTQRIAMAIILVLLYRLVVTGNA